MTFGIFMAWVKEEFRIPHCADDAPSPVSVTACQSTPQSTTSTSVDTYGSPLSMMGEEVEKEITRHIAQPRAMRPLADALSGELVTAVMVEPILRPKRPAHSPSCVPYPQEYVCVHDNGRRCPKDASFRKKKSTYVEVSESYSTLVVSFSNHCFTSPSSI